MAYQINCEFIHILEFGWQFKVHRVAVEQHNVRTNYELFYFKQTFLRMHLHQIKNSKTISSTTKQVHELAIKILIAYFCIWLQIQSIPGCLRVL